MKFRYYITNTFDGCMEGTNNGDKADELSACEEYFVVDTETCEWLTASGERLQIEERD